MKAFTGLNLGLRFLLELAALAALGYWGAQAGGSTATNVALAVAAPLGAAVAWGAFVAPKRMVAVSEPVRLTVELLVFGAATAGLAAAGRTTLAVVFAAAALANSALVRLLDR